MITEKMRQLKGLAEDCVSMKVSVDTNAAYANFIALVEPQDILEMIQAIEQASHHNGMMQLSQRLADTQLLLKRTQEKLGDEIQKPVCNHEWISSQGRTSSGWLCNKCGDYDGPNEATRNAWSHAVESVALKFHESAFVAFHGDKSPGLFIRADLLKYAEWFKSGEAIP